MPVLTYFSLKLILLWLNIKETLSHRFGIYLNINIELFFITLAFIFKHQITKSRIMIMNKSIFVTSALAACILSVMASTSVAAEKTSKNIASGDYAFSNSSQSYGDNGYYDDPQGVIRAFDNDP